MGPSRYHRHGVIGKAYKLLVATPSCFCGMLCSICSRCDQTKGKARWNRCCTHLMSERNWVMVGFYMLLVYTAEILYLCKALPHLQASLFSKFISWFLVFLSEFLYTKAILADPGTVTPQSLLEERRQYFIALENEAKKWADKKLNINVWKDTKNNNNISKKEKNKQKKNKMKQAKLDNSNKLVEVEKETREIKDDVTDGNDGNKCMSILNKITFRRGSSKAKTESAKSKHHFYYSPELEHKLNTRYVVDGVLYAQQMHHQPQSSPLSLSPSPSPSPSVSVSVSVNEQEPDKEENECSYANKNNTKEHHNLHKRKSSGNNKKNKHNTADKSHKGKEDDDEDEYEFDEIELGVECVTCHAAKPARSKHCSLCKSCVRRYDHHCPWINNDVAEGTQRYFIGFLFCHALSCTYACWDLLVLIKQFLQNRNAWGWQLVIHPGRIYSLTFMDYIGIIITYQTLPACLLFFAFCIGIILYAFSMYELSYALTNLTMNDLNKIDEIVEYFTGLDTVEDVYTEASRIKDQLMRVACRKPTALLKLSRPNLPTPLANEKDKKYEYRLKRYRKKYRRDVAKMLTHDLKGLYDRGYYANLMEVFLPYYFPVQIDKSGDSNNETNKEKKAK